MKIPQSQRVVPGRWALFRPHITDVFVMRRLVKREILEFIVPGGTNRWVILSWLSQDLLDFSLFIRLKCHVLIL